MASILVIDDNKGWRDYIRHVFPDYLVTGAPSGETGLATYKQLMKDENTPNLVILDVMMNGLNGLDTAKMIKNVNANANILIMSFYPGFSKEGGDFKFTLKNEFDTAAAVAVLKKERLAFVSKNISPEALVAKVEKVIATNATTE